MDTNNLPEQDAPSQIVINGQEYSPEDAQSYIELGKKTREMEQKWNTTLDSVWPKYGQLSQERSQWTAKEQDYQRQLSEFQTKQDRGTETAADITQAKEAARKLGITLNEDLEKGGYVKKDELDKYFTEKTQQQQAMQKYLDDAENLGKEINAGEPPVKFKTKAVLAYANTYGISDLRAAYEEMNEDLLKPWKEAKLAQSRAKGLQTLKPGGHKEPAEIRPKNDDEFKAQLREALNS